MRSPVPRVLVVPLLAALACSTAVARAEVVVYESAYVPTTSSILLEPAYAYTSTGYSYVLPTAYETSYIAETPAYVVPTALTYYRRPGLLGRLFGRRSLLVESAAYVPMSYEYIPSSYVLPTTYSLDLPVLAAGPVCCDAGEVVSAPAASAAPAPSAAPGRKPAGGSSADEPKYQPDVLKSQPRKPAQPAAPATPAPKPAAPTLPSEAPAATSPVPAPAPSEPAPPTIPPVDTEKPLVPPPGDGAASSPPPGDLLNSPQAGATRPATGSGATRLAMRPASYTRARTPLVGKVVSAASGQPEKGVRVTLVPNSNLYRPKSAVTDANGQFQVVLTEGDWTVQVPKPGDATATIDRPITVAGGLITDDKDDEVTSLTINR